jgi:glycine hydroxymethyltransferase
MVPFDDKSPFVTSGMRVGTAAMTTRGLKESDMSQIVEMVDKALMNHDNETVLKSIKTEVNEWVKQFPLYL